ncbi:hypothetical protein [Flavobacterium sp. ov086]|uniref:hypothetical protein n=1 Tax=Flavobacterium sp. ov086 TaxID=1761785 RepID=UPI000B71097F|nr:hypothetical protein [Flavobacterium sp. ov086]SNR73689.1 hypothetical protein SAMN04487979_1198 [Flavobacterium sp. ov086]
MNNEFHDVIKDSLCNVEKKYIEQITVTSRTKYNERVFCYELYHQLRRKSEEFKNLTISGEAVKSEFQFKNLGKNKTPDILIHNFGTIENNEVVIEVKTSKNKQSVLQGLKKDILVLDLFTDNTTLKIDYKLGLYIVFHFDFFELLNENEKIKKSVKRILCKNKRIVLWNIPEPKYCKDNKLDVASLKIYTNEDLKKKIGC